MSRYSVRSVPHLPKDFVDDLLAQPMNSDLPSVVYNEAFLETRTEIVAGTNPNLQRCHDHEDATSVPFLHYAATYGDPLLACEMMRLGAETEYKDNKGETPLILALRQLSQFRSPGFRAYARTTRNGEASIQAMERVEARLRYIVRMLLTQHADPNSRSADTPPWTPLQFACGSQDWDIVELLIRHGANPTPTPSALTSSTDKTRFRSLVRSTPRTPRPPRICPCFTSGATLASCHGGDDFKPYPLHFLCRCGSKKAYEECCLRRKIPYVEKWDEKEQWIQPSRQIVRSTEGFSPEQRQGLEFVMDYVSNMPNNGIPGGTDGVYSVLAGVVEPLFKDGLIDPGFYAAFHDVKELPLPYGRTRSKRECAQIRDEWNAAVDRYIASGLDTRPQIEIERAAKIGLTCGALYRVCEAEDCGRMEGREVHKLQTCAKCSIAVYCSRQCQKASWPAHKPTCGRPGEPEQGLPSQSAINQANQRHLEKIGSLLGGRP